MFYRSTDDFTNSEFQYYNVYRSSKYFTDVKGMTPYASGKIVYELRNLEKVFYLDRDPITNDAVWYAVTIVTIDGREQKVITPAKVCTSFNILTLSGPGGGLRGLDGQTHSCQSETSYPMMPKLGDF